LISRVDNTPKKILCLGTRNERKIDLFRFAFLGSKILSKIYRYFEYEKLGFRALGSSSILNLSRSNIKKLRDKFCIGIEINPDAKREDVHIGSFDEMPADWNENLISSIRTHSINLKIHMRQPKNGGGF
jgi:hypothetical protein